MEGPSMGILQIIIQVVLLVAVIVLAVIVIKGRSGGDGGSEKMTSQIDNMEKGMETRLIQTRQELENKIGQVGETVVNWMGKQNEAFLQGIDKMRDSVTVGLADGRKAQDEHLKGTTDQVDKRISEAIKEINRQLEANVKVIQTANKDFSDRIDASTKVFADVKQELGKIEEAQKRVGEVGLKVEELANILQAPKARGGLGEVLLEGFLAQWLPKNNYELQYGFADGQKVDAIVRLQGGIVPIDAKFPLENFRKLMSSKEGDDIEKGAKVRFRNDVKKHVDDIARKYIRPTEGTFEFAFMYIPAENVYYEIITAAFEGEQPLCDYAIGKRVIPVSPSNFFAYLMTVAMGLKGMALEERTKEVLAKLHEMTHEMCDIVESYQVVGNHLRNATKKYTETGQRLSKFSNKIDSLTAGPDDDPQALADTSTDLVFPDA